MNKKNIKNQKFVTNIMFSVFVIGLFLLLLGCVEPPEPPKELDDSGATVTGISTVVDANNLFALNLYSNLKDNEQGNIFFSPYSVSTAMVMVYEGAEGQTADEIQSVFHFPEDDNVRRSSFAAIYNQLNRENTKYELNTANALWVQKDYQLLDEYTDTIKRYYGGNATNVDFVGEPEKSRQTINVWIEDQTNNKIKDLIPRGGLDAYTRLVLTNAIYFKGTWVKQFDPENTKEEDFRVSPENTVKVQMMSIGEEAIFNYTETDELQILELPYSGEKLSMLILLPKEDDLSSIEESLTTDKLAEWRNNLKEEDVNVYIPKFKFNTKYFMVQTLSNMGMPHAFTGEADLSGIDGTTNLFIQNVIHQAFVEVNEEGTEAAAATAISVGMSAVPQQQFRADHPFIFIIQDKETGNILFMGRVNDPTSQ